MKQGTLKQNREKEHEYFNLQWEPLIFDQQLSVQSLSRVRLFAIPWTAAHQASLSITNSWSQLKLTLIELVELQPPQYNPFVCVCVLVLKRSCRSSQNRSTSASSALLIGEQTWITVIFNGLLWKQTEIILSLLRLHPSTAFRTLLLTMLPTPFLLRDSCPQQQI